MMRRIRGNLGVSTIIANILMIAITLSLSAILIVWAGTSYGAFSGGTQIFFQQRGQALQELLVVENVFFNKTQSRIIVFVRNTGAIDVNILTLYANGTSLTPQNTGGNCVFSGTTGSINLPVGSVCGFNLQWGSTSCTPNHCPWRTGDTFYIVVATARGNQATYTARGP